MGLRLALYTLLAIAAYVVVCFRIASEFGAPSP